MRFILSKTGLKASLSRSSLKAIFLGRVDKRRPIGIAIGLAIVTSLGISGCENQERSTGSLSDLAKRGRVVYSTQCTACHNSDPHLPGSLGPEIFGSSKELLEARILRAAYPTVYKPKRQTRTMAPLPHLKSVVDAFHAYLNPLTDCAPITLQSLVI
jgi:mono/diheme cytochrome c family protein